MKRVVFKNFPPKSWLREEALHKIACLEEKYPELSAHECLVTIECLNSPKQAGPDEYAVSIHVTGPRHKKLHLRKTSENFFKGLAHCNDRVDEVISRSRGARRKIA